MKTHQLAVLLVAQLCFQYGSARAEDAGDGLRFLNGDRLHGTFVSYGKEGIRWQTQGAGDLSLVQLAALAEVDFHLRERPDDAASPAQFVELRNGDVISGAVISLDDKNLLLETWYAGKLSIPKDMIKGIVAAGGAGIVYEGPLGPRDWTVMQYWGSEFIGKNWTVKDGALVATGWGLVSRDVKLPACAKIELDLGLAEGDQGTTTMEINFYGNMSDVRRDSYAVSIMNYQHAWLVQVLRHGQGHTKAMSESIQWHDPQSLQVKHFDIRVDKEAKTIWLFINHVMLGKWTDKEEFAGPGTSMLFSTRRDTHAIISNIKISGWDGKVEDEKNAGDAEAAAGDKIIMNNRDVVSGKLKGIADGKALFTSSYSDLTIPLDHIRRIEMAAGGVGKAAAAPAGVHAELVDGSSITLTLEQWKDNEVVVSSSDFGRAVFLPAIFKSLRFGTAQ